MAVIESASSGALQEVGAASSSPSHVVVRHQPYGSLGSYSVAARSGAIGAGAGADSEIFQFRWTDNTGKLAIIHGLWITGIRATTAFAAGAIDLRLTVARNWTADGTGGTALTLTGNTCKLRTSMGTTLAGSVRVPTTAALGAGTKTFDGVDIGQITSHSSAGWNSATPIIGQTYLPTHELFTSKIGDAEHPIVLSFQEGFSVRATVPATGVWNVGFLCKWSEVTAY